MTQSIFVRVQRVVSSGLDTAVGTVEQLSGTSLMRQALRDMDVAIEKARSESETVRTRRLQAAHQLDVSRKALGTLKDQARFALGKGREDLAQAAITRQIDIEAQVARLTAIEAEAGEEEQRLDASIADLRLRRGQMADELEAFVKARRAAAADGDSPTAAGARAARKAERAEEAFRRAMEAAGVPDVPGDAAAAAKVAEIEALQKEAAVAERLAALRAAEEKAAAPRKARAAR